MTTSRNGDDESPPPALMNERDSYGFDTMDPDDPNYVHLEKYREAKDLIDTLPDGWSRNTNSTTSNQAPFVHVSGKVSWKHPNFSKIKAISDEQQAQKAPVADRFTRSQIKKLRLMLQSGIPLEAVKQKARLEGIDMAMVLNTATTVSSPKEEETKSSSSSNEKEDNTTPMGPPAHLIKKYKRMLKCGVNLAAVQQLAHAQGGWTPEQVSTAVFDDEGSKSPSSETTPQDDDNEATIQYKPCKKPKYDEATKLLSKYKRMLQSGVPVGAIQQTAIREGVVDSETLLIELGVNKKPLFTPVQPNSLSFSPSNSNLAALVRKMVQTVQKRASTSKNDSLVVDNRTLYHALGALQGVQWARDKYNRSATTTDAGETKANQQAFIEIARSIGMDLPTTTTTIGIDGLDELILHIETVFKEELMALQTQMEEGWYDFDSLALLYPPGSKVVAKNAGGGGVDMICQVVWNRYEEGRTIMGKPMKYFKVCFQYVVAVGASHATLAEVVEGMEMFEGRRQIHSSATLTFVPLAAYTVEQKERLLDRYRRRGHVYNQVALCGKHTYMSYQKGCFFLKRAGGGGNTFDSSGGGNAALATGGRIIIDTQGAYDHGHSLGVGYDPMVQGIKYKYKEFSLELRSIQQNKQQQQSGGRSMAKPTDDDSGLILFEKVPEDYLEMVWPCVVGFSLTAKAWGDILVDGLEEIKWQEDIFDRLVLPEKRKRIVKALVRQGSSSSFQDLVQGKGEGTVFLMYGPPGVGKTLTAEAVAELLHKPLYSLSMGTLGTTPGELEQRLGQIMNLAAKWDALILLDEADSFLETRSSNSSSLERNAMVSVMLKLVEYFSGILFLTSNRIESLDPAFQTRITLALRYEPLDVAARTQVWKNLLIKSGFDDKDAGLDASKLAKACVLNGREIKNALRLAMAMAAEEAVPLSQEMLLETIDIVSDYKTTTMVDSFTTNRRGEKEKGCGFLWW